MQSKITKYFTVICFLFITLLSFPFSARAGFGISPPYVKTNTLLPGSRYEQVITLLRSSAEEELEANIIIDAPEIQSWIQIDKGNKFIMPPGELQVPMKVIVSPPENAELGNYTGHINVRVAPNSANITGSGVAIALGARVDIDINLTDEESPDFKIRNVSVPGIEMLESPWDWPILRWFFYRLKVAITLENTGNVDIAPSKVTMEVYDILEREKIETLEDKSIKKVKPYEVAQTHASFPTNLVKGDYWGKVKIYKDNEVVNSYKIAFRVAEAGTYPEGRIDLGRWPIIILVGTCLVALAMIALMIKLRIWRKVYFMLKLLLWPLSFGWKQLDNLLKYVNKKFWKWIKSKADKFDEK